MPAWSGNKVNPAELNDGNEWDESGQVALEELNAMVNGGLYAQNYAEALTDTPDNSNANNVGTASVELVDNIKDGKTYKKFKFNNLKGQTGATGATGADGEQGIQGATGTAYRAMGVWSSATTYVNNADYIDTVQFGGSTYYAKVNNTNQSPTDGADNAYWGVLALKGSVDIVQTTGTSTTAVMSQKAVSEVLVYDVVVRTQTDFETLIASPNWLGATSVAFVGDGGALVFTLSDIDNGGIKVPDNVKTIKGFNTAKIEVTNFKYNASTGKGGLWYNTQVGSDYSISGLTVFCGVDSDSRAYAFVNFNNITNCLGHANAHTASGASSKEASGFYLCKNISNSTGSGVSSQGGGVLGAGKGFNRCTNITNSIGSGVCANITPTGGGEAYGFYLCKNISNSTGNGQVSGTTNGNAIGFYSSDRLSNCIGIGEPEVPFTSNGNGTGFTECTQVSNCIGKGTGVGNSPKGTGIGFHSCSYGSNNRDDGSSDYATFGTMIKWSTDSNDV